MTALNGFRAGFINLSCLMGRVIAAGQSMVFGLFQKIGIFNMSHRTFLNILGAITICVIFTTSVVSTLLYINFEKISMDSINKANIQSLSQINNSLNYINESAINLGISILMNNDTKLLLYNKNPDIFGNDTIYTISGSLQRLNQITASVSFVHSIYLYNNTLQTIYSTVYTPINAKADFFDQEIKSYLDQVHTVPLKLFPRKITMGSKIEDVYTYIFYDKSFTGSAKNDAVVLNLRTDWITTEISSMNLLNKQDMNKFSKLFIIDDKGKVVNHPEENMFLKDVSENAYIKKILTSTKDSGYFIDNIDQKKSIVTYISQGDTLHWRLISITPYEAITSQLKQIISFTLNTCIVIISLGLIVAFVLSRRVYTPINSVVENIRELTRNTDLSKDVRGEIQFISDAFHKMLEKTNSLEDFRRSGFLRLKQEMLKEILLQSRQISDELKQKIEKYEVNIYPEGEIQLVLFKIDHYFQFTKDYDERDRGLIRYAIQNIASELLSNDFTSETVDMGGDHIVVIISNSIESFKNPEMKERLNKSINQIHATCLNYLKISFCSFISRPLAGIDKCNELYKETNDLSNYRLIYGHGCIVSTDDVKQIPVRDYKYPVEKQNVLIDALKLGKIQQVKAEFEDMTLFFTNFSCSNLLLSYICLESSIFNTINLFEKNSMVTFNLDYLTFHKELNDLETADEMNAKFMELFEHIASKVEETKTDKNSLIVTRVMDIVHRHFADPNLSTDQIADQLKMSADYLGKVFREQKTCSISEFITQTRLNKARELLISSNLNVNEIAERIGFMNAKYLFKVFKKNFGVTPRDFRLKNSMNSE